MAIDPFLTVGNNGYSNISTGYLLDNEEKIFKKNKKKLKIYKDGLYINKPIDYTLNKFGYRCNHVIPPAGDYILALGCSHTFGQGLHKEHRYTDLLESYYNIPVLNIGIYGGSCNLIKDNLIQLFSSGFNLPKNIIIQWPNKHRLFYGTYRLQNDSKTTIQSMESLKQYSETSQNHSRWLLYKYEIPFVEFTVHNEPQSQFPNFYIDVARDLDHPGIESNQKIFEYIRKQINEKRQFFKKI